MMNYVVLFDILFIVRYNEQLENHGVFLRCEKGATRRCLIQQTSQSLPEFRGW